MYVENFGTTSVRKLLLNSVFKVQSQSIIATIELLMHSLFRRLHSPPPPTIFWHTDVDQTILPQHVFVLNTFHQCIHR